MKAVILAQQGKEKGSPKEKPTDGIISKYINRKISKRITTRIVNTNLTPTQITIMSFIMALASAAFFFLGEYTYWTLQGGISVWIIGLFALLGSFMISYTNARYEGVFEKSGGCRGIPIRRDMRLFIIMIGAFLNLVLVMLLLLAILTNLEVVRWVFSSYLNVEIAVVLF
jgi:hypothetical protein